MKYFKNIEVIENKPLKKIVRTESNGNDFLMEFLYKDNSIKISFLKSFLFKGNTLWGKIKYCYKILFNKPIILNSVFEFENGEHVIDVSDALYIFSREIRR